MKNLALILLFCCLGIGTAFSQGHTANWNPEDTFSFIKIKLLTPHGTAYANSPVVLKGVKGHVVKVTTDKDGRAKAKVPYDDTYTLHCGEHTCMRTVAVSDFPYVTYNVQGYTRRFIYYTFTYRAPGGGVLEGEEVIIHSTKTGEKYVDTTNAKGQCYFILPFDPEFRISVKYHDNVKTVAPLDVGKEYKVMSCDFTWMGSKEKERLAHIADSLSRASYAGTIALLDSLMKTNDKDAIAKMDVYIPIGYDSTEWVAKMLKKKAEAYKKQLNVNPKFFEEQNKAVLGPLYRLKQKFAHQLIVTDITGSMYPYMEQVLLWHALNFMGDQRTKYLFFNDGDGKATHEKKIGSTGGLYYCQGKISDFNTIINTMRTGMRNGVGGEYPENDVEALLAASEKRGSYDELFLIADNYSPVRDLSLMKELKMPVRIIVCGVEDGGSSFWGKQEKTVNEEYLDLARATGGSIHTIKEDIYDLAKTKEGDSITIKGKKYDFINGRFVMQEKL